MLRITYKEDIPAVRDSATSSVADDFPMTVFPSTNADKHSHTLEYFKITSYGFFAYANLCGYFNATNMGIILNHFYDNKLTFC